MKKILVCGHRGFPAQFPQNTLPSFAGAAAAGCDRIEYDLYWTADRKLVVCHNDTVDSTSNGTGKIGGHTLPAGEVTGFLDGKTYYGCIRTRFLPAAQEPERAISFNRGESRP